VTYFDERERNAYALMQSGEWLEAVAIYEQVVSRLLDSFGKQVYDNYQQGNWQDAETYLKDSFDLNSAEVTDRLRYAGRLLINIGMLRQNLREPEVSRRAYYFASMLQLRLLGDETPEVAAMLFNTGRLLQAYGEREEAWDYLTRSIDLWRRIIVDDETAQYLPFFASCLHLQGRLLADIGQVEEARLHYEEALERRRSALKPNDPDIALNLSDLGKLYLAQGDSVAAKACLEESLAIYTPALGDEHPIVSGLRDVLAEVEEQ
jgi:tetratricopeptide (TPR) repeat protein